MDTLEEKIKIQAQKPGLRKEGKKNNAPGKFQSNKAYTVN